MEPRESPYTKEFSTLRVVMLIEERSFSNVYHQVAFSLADFQAMMNLMYSILPTSGPGMLFKMTGPSITLPDDIKSINQ